MLRESYYLINQTHLHEGWHDGMSSGWNYDNRGAKKMPIDKGPYTISNVSGEFPTAIIREMQVAKEGVFTLENSVTFTDGFDGFVMSLYDENEKEAMRIITEDGEFKALGGGNEYVTLFKPENTVGKFWFSITVDYDENTVTYYINSTWCATLPVLASSFKFLKIGTLEGHILGVEPSGAMDLYANYPLCDSFQHFPVGSNHPAWKVNGNVAITDRDDLQLLSETSTKSTAYRKFDKQNGKLLLETYHFNYSNGGETVLEAMCGKNVLFTVSTKNKELYLNGEKVRYFLDEMWYRFRFELDTKTGKGTFSVNSKKPWSFEFDKGGIDGLLYTSKDGADLRIDNLKLQHVFEYEDYCPQPVAPKGYGDYTVGINMCSLWHTGCHAGWDFINPFAENKPILGYYDEGLPEVADWEIKFMVENGITAQFYCWYLGGDNNRPLKKTRLSDALVDGFLNAKYSHMMNFGILFEAQSTPASPEAFKKYVVPFWIENFFTDERYVKIGNKAVICIYALPQIVAKFGSTEAVKDCFDFLRNEVKKLGYEDLIIFSNCNVSKLLRECGIDAGYVYGWLRQGCDPNYQISSTVEKLRDLPHFIPTASTGFNRLPWDTERSPCISVEDWRYLLTHFRDVFLPSFKDKPDWTHKFIMLSNWNEYGEGTYICPSGLNEFGYVEGVRDVFTQGFEDGFNPNIKPTANQLKRLSTLYPQDRKNLRCLEEKPLSKNILFDVAATSYDVILDMKPTLENWKIEQADVISTDNGTIRMKTTDTDPKMTYKGELNFDCETANGIRLVVDSDITCWAPVYYITDENPLWGPANKAVTTLKKGTHEYIIPFHGNKRRSRPYAFTSFGSTYKGKVLGLRFDPNEAIGYESELIECQLIHINANKISDHLFINGEDMVLDNDIVIDNGHYMVPIFPERNILYRLNAFYKYNGNKKVLSLYGNHTSAIFELGSRTAYLGGEKVTLDCVPYFDNGLPMIPIDIVCKTFGYTFTKKDGNYYITTPFDK